MNNTYLIIIIAFLPLAAGMVLIQVNPYHALVIRGVLGAIAALLEAVLGAADVALTEALVGTLLAITLYAVAVRSSMVMRLAVLQDTMIDPSPDFKSLMTHFRKCLQKYHLRLELVPYDDTDALYQALTAKEVHGICFPKEQTDATRIYEGKIRLKRLYDLINKELPLTTHLTYETATDLGETH